MAIYSTDRLRLPLLALFSAAVVLLSAATPCQAQPVLDANGDPVRVDSLYRIKYLGTGFFGGVTVVLPPANGTRCGSRIGLGQETDPGLPLSITPGSPSQAPGGVLRQSVRSRIEFRMAATRLCAAPRVWTAAATGPFTAIVAGRQPGSPPVTNEWFEVRAADQERAYTLIYCRACLACEVFCDAKVGAFDLDGETVLGVGGRAFPVRFEKVSP